MADKTVTITLTGNTDPNGPDNFIYNPGYLQVHPEDRVSFTCNHAFAVKFLNSSPFDVSEISSRSASTSEYFTIRSNAKKKSYHYAVMAINSDGLIQMDAGCPTLDVL